MQNVLWFSMIVLSVVCGCVTGRIGDVSAAAAGGADKAVRLVISMAGVMALWTGLLRIADKSGVTGAVSRLLAPLLSRLMPDYPKNSPAMRAVSANITANLLGLGNAATPLGLNAMKEMQKTNRLRTAPNDSMIMFVVLNTASIQLIPSTIGALRQAAGGQAFSVMPHIWLASFAALLTGIFAARIFSGRGEADG